MSHHAPGALLLDLDDTLLKNPMEAFLPPYFRALGEVVSEFVAPERWQKALRHAIRGVMAEAGGEVTVHERIWREIVAELAVERGPLQRRVERFYDEEFGVLDGPTAPVDGAPELVAAARGAGWRVVVATNPIFPYRAVSHRIRWAGLDEDLFDLVTHSESMHAAKPHAAYFAEIAARLDLPPARCVMAGNNLGHDLAGAARIGMRTFWVDTFPVADVTFEPDGRGDLAALRRWLFPSWSETVR